VLFNLYEQVSAKAGASEEVSQQLKRRVLEAIGMYASVASSDLIATFYTRLSQMFGEATQRVTASANRECLRCSMSHHHFLRGVFDDFWYSQRKP
jgi:hypothetical protein